MSEIRIFSFGFPPKGWAPCNGQLLPVNSNQALYSLLGTAYGGDGINTFGLPNLQGAVPMHVGTNMPLGTKGGESTHSLSIAEIPGHTHTAVASSSQPNASTPQGNYWPSNTGYSPYGLPSNPPQYMSPQAIGSTGVGQGHNNMAPFAVVNICIALIGIYPTRN